MRQLHESPSMSMSLYALNLNHLFDLNTNLMTILWTSCLSYRGNKYWRPISCITARFNTRHTLQPLCSPFSHCFQLFAFYGVLWVWPGADTGCVMGRDEKICLFDRGTFSWMRVWTLHGTVWISALDRHSLGHFMPPYK